MQLVNRLFNLRPGDFTRGLPLFAYYFLIISFYMMGRVARAAIFLDHFTAVQLPYADISIAALAGVLAALYIRAGRRTSLRNLQAGSLLFFAANLVVLWWGLHVEQWAWLAPVFYVWVGICGILCVTQVWMLVNFVWTTREAKRLVGMVGSGGIIGGSVGGFLARWIALRFGTESTLLFMAVWLVMCTVIVRLVCQDKRTAPAASENLESQDSPRNLRESFRLVRQSPHLRTIAALICLCSIVTTAAGWQLTAIAKETLVEKDVLAAFLGSLAGYIGIASLIAQLLITTKVLRRFGVGIALLILPLSLTAGSLAVLVWGTLWAATALRASDGVIRYSIDTSALQLLYLPVPANIKVQVKSFIDTVIWKLGDGLAALTLLLFATTLGFTPRQISWVTLVLLVLWIGAAIVARRQYVATLRENIQRVRIQPENVSVPVLDQSTSTVFAEKLSSPDQNEVLYALNLFEIGQDLRTHAAVRNLLEHSSRHIRKKTISILNAAGDKSVKPQIMKLLQDKELEVRTEALRYLTQHDHLDPLAHIEQLGEFADFSVRSATVAFLARPGEAQNIEVASLILDGMVHEEGEKSVQTRAEAARLIASLPDHFEDQLQPLMQDSEPAVLRPAMYTAATLRKRRFVPTIIGRLGSEKLASDAADALALFGDAVVGTLRDHLNDPDEPIEVRRQIPQALVRIGTPAAAAVLSENLFYADTILRFRIISALNKLLDSRRNITIDPQLVETVMIAELMGHYRSYQILGTIDATSTSAEALKESMKEEVERIFRLMKLLSPGQDLESAYLGLQSTDPVMHANALEFLDATLKPQLRNLVVPLIDTEISERERARLADRLLGVKVKSQAEAVAVLKNTEDPWLKSCVELWLNRGSTGDAEPGKAHKGNLKTT